MSLTLDAFHGSFTLGVICLALAVLLFLFVPVRPGFRRLFFAIVLGELGLILLFLSVPTLGKPPEQTANSSQDWNYFPGTGGGQENDASINPEPGRNDSDPGTANLRPNVLPNPIVEFGAGDALAPPGGSVSGSSRKQSSASIAGLAGPISGANLFPHQWDYYRVVFALDISGSMNEKRFERLTKDLAARLLSLEDETPFAIILFNARAVQLPGESSLRWHPKSAAEVAQVIGQLRTLQPNDGTAPFGALKQALELQPRAIICLTDGDFNVLDIGGAGATKESLVQEIKQTAAKQHTRIYGIFIGEPGAEDYERGRTDLKSLVSNPRNFFEARP